MRRILSILTMTLLTCGSALAAPPTGETPTPTPDDLSGIQVAAAPEAPPAEGDAPATSDRPWADGVPEENQAKATALFNEATELLKDAFFKRAIDLYKEAVGQWDHPAIHFNLAKALMNLDDPAAAYKHLKDAMRFGGQPLTDEQQEQVTRFTKLLYDTELAELIVECEEPGAVVTLDGVELFVAPGSWRGVVRPEQTKALVATKEGFQTQQLQPELIKGQINTIKLEPIALQLVTTYVTEFDKWIPWAVLGGGVAILGGGGFLSYQTGKSYDDYDAAVEACNAAAPFDVTLDTGTVASGAGRAGTCISDSSVTDKKDQGDTFQTLSVVAYAVGGAAVATSVVLFIINRERPVVSEDPVDPDAPEAAPTPVSVMPYVGPQQGGITATFGF